MICIMTYGDADKMPLFYDRHSDEMIDRLKNAGLGFYVRESETMHKLGLFALHLS